MSTASAPIEIGHVTLTVHDLPGVAGFYQQALGLARLSSDGAEVVLGAGTTPFLRLRSDPAARRRTPSEAGLFHTAFLLPDRRALARWMTHVATTGLALEGASDHLVSEAIYLSDPEGNGIEVYADRPRSGWTGPDGRIRMDTRRLDLHGLMHAADGPWTGAPEGTVIGHVHLQVGDVPTATTFWQKLGFQVMAQYPGAGFFGSGGYHHHIAGNVWNSRGAGPRAMPSTGLTELGLRADPDQADRIGAAFGPGPLTDPWGTPITVTAKP
jgi:catechol 2,3-dioxygenase